MTRHPDKPTARGAPTPHADVIWPVTHSSASPWSPRDVRELYGLPRHLSGRGQCIGVLAPGGGFHTSDLEFHFARLGVRAPMVSTVSVDGATNDPRNSSFRSAVEVALNLELAGGVAPEASLVVYFTHNTDRGWIDAIRTVVSDSAHRPSVLLITWGCAESLWAPETVCEIQDAFAEAAALGITVCCATGNQGSSGGVPDGLAHVDFPGSSPLVLACGGTSVDFGEDGVPCECVWNDGPDGGCTGGGVSDLFDLPAWQVGCGVPGSVNPGSRIGRGVPDVAAAATGYQLRVFNEDLLMSGTSASASIWAGLVALHNGGLRKHQRSGLLNPLVYCRASASGAFHDVTVGDNGAYAAGRGWDACTGWGSLIGDRLLRLMQLEERLTELDRP